MFESLVGNPSIKDCLSRIIRKNIIGNSFLFAGPDGVGKSLFALEFAKEVLCRDDSSGSHRCKMEAGCHPDFHLYKPEGKTGMHTIDAMRQFCTEVNMPPYEAKNKVFVILEAERMLPYSANALLKTFEEPTLDSLIILVSSRPSALLTTILSRCRKFNFQALSPNDIVQILEKKDFEKNRILQIAQTAQGSVSQALRLLQPEFNHRRTQLLKILSQGVIQDYTQLSLYSQQLAKEIEAEAENESVVLREVLMKGFLDKPSAVQQQAIEKEIEGIVAMQERNSVNSIFEIILSWFRDLELLAVSNATNDVFNQEFILELINARQKGATCTLEKAFKAIQETRISLDRSTNLSICLENLFLKINML